MVFTRQHFEQVADIIERHTIKDGCTFVTNTWQLSSELADMFAKDNDMFDREKFLSACGVRRC